MATLYTDKHLVARARKLAEEGRGYKHISKVLVVSTQTVRKMLNPDHAVRERERQHAVDLQRAPRWENPVYREYQTAYGATDARKEQVKHKMRELKARRRANPSTET